MFTGLQQVFLLAFPSFFIKFEEMYGQAYSEFVFPNII